MAIVIPAIRGRMGSTTYYETKMSATDLAAHTRAASDSDTWASMSIEERIQRDLNKTRVRDQIVPYLMRDPDRLFGSVLVLAKGGGLEFEPFSRYAADDIPVAQRAAAQDLGLLNIVDGDGDGGSDLIVLDGQHRMAALRSVVMPEHADEADAAKAREVARDEIAVIFFESDDTEKIRRLFNKINRQAKPATRADNIITSEDDGFAIVARRLLRVGHGSDESGPLGVTYPPNNDLFVEWKTNTIADAGFKLTTMSTVYESVKVIVPAAGIDMAQEAKLIVRPDERTLDAATVAATEWWRRIIDGLTPLREAAADPRSLPRLRERSRHKLLLKPNGQQALVKGLALAVGRGADLDDAIARADQIDWGTPEIWREVLMKKNGNMIARSENYNAAAELIAYLVASEHTNKAQRKQANLAYADIRGEHKDLPRDEVPDCLPDPIA